MNDFNALLASVPRGEEAAEGFREIWTRFGLWSPITVRHKLTEMADVGAIQRKVVPIPGGTKHLYFRPIEAISA